MPTPSAPRRLLHIAWLMQSCTSAAIAIAVQSARAADASTPATTTSTQPGTAPTTAPILDLATPKTALRALNRALRDGDADRILQVLEAHNPAEQKVAVAMSQLAAAMGQLHQSAVGAFGPEGAKAVAGDSDAESANGLTAIDRAAVVVENDSATVDFRDGKSAVVHLQRVAGQWKLPVAALQESEGSKRADHVRRLDELTTAAQQVAEEINVGRYKTADKAAVAWRTRAMQAMASGPGARPATQPVREPGS